MPEATPHPEPDTKPACIVCGTTVVRRAKGGPLPKTCSPECWKANRKSLDSQKHWPRCTVRYGTCAYCGDLFTYRGQALPTRCRKPECKRQWNNERQRAFNERWKAEHDGEWYVYKFLPAKVERNCQWCGRAFRKRGQTRTCGHACQRALVNYHYLGRARRRQAEAKIARAAAGTCGRLWVAGNCYRCGVYFVGPQCRDRAGFCSDQCARANKKARRRARQRGAHVERVSRIKVFIRDGWRCKLCGKKVDKTKRAPHPLAPTLDHVIPLARGGAHSMANANTAHSICNSRKRELGGGEQLALFG